MKKVRNIHKINDIEYASVVNVVTDSAELFEDEQNRLLNTNINELFNLYF